MLYDEIQHALEQPDLLLDGIVHVDEVLVGHIELRADVVRAPLPIRVGLTLRSQVAFVHELSRGQHLLSTDHREDVDVEEGEVADPLVGLLVARELRFSGTQVVRESRFVEDFDRRVDREVGWCGSTTLVRRNQLFLSVLFLFCDSLQP